MSFTYTTGLPNPPDDPSSNVSSMQTNTNTISSWTQVDHVGFNNVSGGKHLQVTYVAPVSAPSVSGTVGIGTTQTVTNTEQFFTNAAANMQITNSLLSYTSAQGMFPGGLQIRCGTGSITTNNTDQTLTYNLTFPTATLFAVACYTSASPAAPLQVTNNSDATRIHLKVSLSSGSANVNYIAVGY